MSQLSAFDLVSIRLEHVSYDGPRSCHRWGSVAAVLNAEPAPACSCVSCESARFNLGAGVTAERNRAHLAAMERARRARR